MRSRELQCAACMNTFLCSAAVIYFRRTLVTQSRWLSCGSYLYILPIAPLFLCFCYFACFTLSESCEYIQNAKIALKLPVKVSCDFYKELYTQVEYLDNICSQNTTNRLRVNKKYPQLFSFKLIQLKFKLI